MAAKEKKNVRSEKKMKESFLNSFKIDNYIPQKYQTPVLFLIILLIFLLFYSPLYFGGKTFQSGDIITSKSALTYIEQHSDGFTLWNPYIFGGMPSYAITVGWKWFNLVYTAVLTVRDAFGSVFTVDYAKWTFYLLAFAYTMFTFFYHQTKTKLVSFLVAIATAFSTGLIVFLFIGHVTKLSALWVFPILFVLLFNFQKRIKLFEIFLLIFFLAALLIHWHVQIIFYIFFAVMIYFIYFFLRSLRRKDIHLRNQILKSAGVFVLAVVVGILIHSDNLTQIYEYTPYSTRGTESIVDKETGPTNKSASEFYQYATNWSFSLGEVITFIVPSYYGFGKSTYQGPLSQNQPVEVNTYFGQMPFVDVAMYMGVVIFFLALFAIISDWKNPLVRFLAILSLISLVISFGSTMPLLYDLMFYYFPFFNKFRVPSMILVLVQISFPILAGIGVLKIISIRKESNRRLEILIRNAMFGFGGLFVLALLFSSPIKDWFVDRIVSAGPNYSHLNPLHDYMADMFVGDLRLAMLFTGFTFVFAYAYLKAKLSADLLVIFICLIVIIDLFRINYRGETLVDNAKMERQFEKPNYIQAIENTGDKSIYRVLNLKQDGSIGSLNQNSNFLSYFLIYDIYGYSGIKPRTIQDYYDVLGSPANPIFWRMLNVKYLILDQQIYFPSLDLIYSNNNTYVYRNNDALPRAYFVSSVEKRRSIEILNMVKEKSFDPKHIAFTDEEIGNIEVPDSNAFVNIVEFKDEYIELDVNASGTNFLFLGETFMSGVADYKIIKIPTGWEAFIDGKKTRIYKTNHGFRGIVVPEGHHKVVFSYLPKSFVVSKYLSLALSALVIIGLIFGIILMKVKNKATERTEV